MVGHVGNRRRLYPGWGDSSLGREGETEAMMRDLGLKRTGEARPGQKPLAQATCPERKPAGVQQLGSFCLFIVV